MADLKQLLGEQYKDGMTIEEVNTALAEMELVDKSTLGNMIDKGLFDKKTSELAEANKKVKQLEAAQQSGKTEQEQAMANLQAQLEALQKDKARSENKAKFLALGYDEALASETATAFTDGDMDKVFANQKKFLEQREQALKAELLKETPKPPAGKGGANTTDYQKMIVEAQQNGDFTAAAYYTRLAAQQETTTT